MAVFTGEKETEFIQAYKNLLMDLGSFLSKNGFKWEKPVRCFNNIYFSKDGSIDYYFFRFYPGQKINEAKQEDFEKLVGKFIQDHKINIQTDKKFSQCSPVQYK